MSNIYPEYLDNNAYRTNRGESKVYDALKNGLDKDWNIYYSVNWNIPSDRKNSQRDAETDFIITHPEYGVLVLEVKGGQTISYNPKDELWLSIDLEGCEHHIKDPYKQARKNKYILIDQLVNEIGFGQFTRDSIHDHLTVGYGVIFPDVDKVDGEFPPEVRKDITIFGINLDKITKEIIRLFSYYSKNKKLESKLASHAHKVINSRLAPTFKLERTLSYWIEDEEKKIIELTDTQFQFLQTTQYITKASIYGCAGSGKTLLAIRKAEILAESKQYVLIVCYNILLGLKFKEHFKNNPYVSAGHHYQLLADRLGLSEPLYDDDKLLDLTLNTDLGKYDALIVDEAQDFSSEKIDLLKLLLKDDGIEYYFWDDNQQVNQSEINVLKDRTLVPLILNTNLRNTTKIFNVVKKHYHKDIPLTHSGPAGRNIEILDPYQPSDTYQWFGQLRSKVNQLLTEENIKSKDIVILTFKGKDKSELKNFTFRKPISLFSDIPAPDSIRIETVRRFKGMESKVVIVTEMDDYYSLHNQQLFDDMCYVSFSRAIHHLIIIPPIKVMDKLV